ncbi:DUF5047 domain-containing protein, partial [Streptomyces sp. A73]|nr:DUF5047 domain-containing protein [Streptomyces sp. A73]
ASVTVPDTSFIPRTPTEQLAIYGAKLRIERGIRYGNGDVETGVVSTVTGGTCAIAWAQSTSSSTPARMGLGSWMRATRIM